MAAGQPPEDEPRYEPIGRDVYDDGGRAGAGGGSALEDDGGGSPPSVPFRTVAAGAVRGAWADTMASFRTVSFWIVLVAAVAGAGLSAYLLLVWFGVVGWEAAGPVALFLLAGGGLSLAAAVLGSVWGFARGRTGAPGSEGSGSKAPGSGAQTMPVRLLACLMRGLALAILGVALLLVLRLLLGAPGPVEFSVDPASGLPETPAGGIPAPPGLELLALLTVLFEVGVFALLGMGFRAWFTARLPGAALTVVSTGLFAVGNFAAAFFLLPGTLVTERTSIPVNVERDRVGRYLSYDCVGDLVRSAPVLHSERVMWLTAGNPALLYWTLASEQVPTEGELGWFLVSLQQSTVGPAYDVACINGVPSDAAQSGFPLSTIGIAGQLAAAAAVTGAGVLAGRRRARSGS
ncbi:hypothetical protein [Arthrobacter celericrescens]|uniref:hypothetical protein n=1 Tax=Arthrobacter celericrescens TaxID=2320851 RepID=UPI000EA0E644|nr:hypothetical protein [Arthrobacter celericrescens]